MNTISSTANGDSGNGHISEAEVQESIFPSHHEVNVTDGGEFLNDAIRMKDQPLEEPHRKDKEWSFSKLL
jgi:hypothetical protein